MDTTVNHILKGFVFAGALGAFGCQGLQAAPPLALGQLNVNGLASDGDNVFWTMASGDVRSVSTLGGGVAQVSNTPTGAQGIALDEDAVYWVTGTGAISRAPKVGGAPVALVENLPPAGAGQAVFQIDEASMYWLGTAQDDSTCKSGCSADLVCQASACVPLHQVFKAAKAPAAPMAALLNNTSLQPIALTLAGGNLYYATADSPGQVAGIEDLSISGGTPVTTVTGTFQLVTSATATLCSAGLDPAALALDPTATAWAVTCSALDGSNAHVVASGLANVVSSLTTDDDNVYFATVDGAVSYVPVNGNAPVDMTGITPPEDTTGCVAGAACSCSDTSSIGMFMCDSSGVGTCQCSGGTTFAKGPPGGASLAIDQTSVYWAHSAADAIFAMPRL
jgi:hypothetical protein